jgi:hypothetical protein
MLFLYIFYTILHNSFENNYERKILYENINCKIYQNYDTSIIFNEIKSTFEMSKGVLTSLTC